MIHIGKDGELLEIGGTIGELGSDASAMLATLVHILKKKEGESEEGEDSVAEFIGAIMMTLLDITEGNDGAAESIKSGMRMALIASDRGELRKDNIERDEGIWGTTVLKFNRGEGVTS